MDYAKHYNKLIARAQNRQITGYVEKHHIIPSCMGGSNDKSNLVKLTAEEHYVAHQLLVKMYPGHAGLIRAANMMIAGRPGNKQYAWLKKLFAGVQSIAQTGINNTQAGTVWIHNNDLKISTRIKKGEQLPLDWKWGRKIKFEKPCVVCGSIFLISGKKQFCSDICKSHARSPSNKIIDNNFDQMVVFFKTCHSIDKTLKHFGVNGTRAGNAQLSKRLKSLGLRVRPSNR